MNRNDVIYRCVGILLLCAMGVCTLIHREVWLIARYCPATLLEATLGLATLCFGSMGTLYLAYGGRLHEDGKRSLDGRHRGDTTGRILSGSDWRRVEAYLSGAALRRSLASTAPRVRRLLRHG